jgi:hypothetical protein
MHHNLSEDKTSLNLFTEIEKFQWLASFQCFAVASTKIRIMDSTTGSPSLHEPATSTCCHWLGLAYIPDTAEQVISKPEKPAQTSPSQQWRALEAT